MKDYKLQGIILKTTNIFEKDKRIEIFTPTEGKVTLLAKFANTKSFKFGGKLDPLNLVECVVRKGKTFLLLLQCDLITPYPEIRQTFNTLTTGCHFLDIVRKTTVEHQENETLYNVLKQHLELLCKNAEHDDIKISFYHGFLENEGVLDHLNTPSTAHLIHLIEAYCNKPLVPPTQIVQA